MGSLTITGGTLRSRRVPSPPGRAVRPTPARVKEALFSILGSRVGDARVLDLFAGSGALGSSRSRAVRRTSRSSRSTPDGRRAARDRARARRRRAGRRDRRAGRARRARGHRPLRPRLRRSAVRAPVPGAGVRRAARAPRDRRRDDGRLRALVARSRARGSGDARSSAPSATVRSRSRFCARSRRPRERRAAPRRPFGDLPGLVRSDDARPSRRDPARGRGVRPGVVAVVVNPQKARAAVHARRARSDDPRGGLAPDQRRGRRTFAACSPISFGMSARPSSSRACASSPTSRARCRPR